MLGMTHLDFQLRGWGGVARPLDQLNSLVQLVIPSAVSHPLNLEPYPEVTSVSALIPGLPCINKIPCGA